MFNEEASYLIDEFNELNQISPSDIIETFSGVRPIVKRVTAEFTIKNCREAVIENDRLINVWGGKWTSALSLSIRC